MNVMVMQYLCAALVAWPWSTASAQEQPVATGGAGIVVPAVPTPEPAVAPDDYQGHVYEYHQYLNYPALIERADKMRVLNKQTKDKLKDLAAGQVGGIELTADQMRQRIVEVSALYYEMVVISYQTINDIVHADAYYINDVDPPYPCPPVGGGEYPGENIQYQPHPRPTVNPKPIK